eukprot:COSAG02_NODE_5407_length_4354_cov_7.370623_2_plen_78_part_00
MQSHTRTGGSESMRGSPRTVQSILSSIAALLSTAAHILRRPLQRLTSKQCDKDHAPILRARTWHMPSHSTAVTQLKH